MIEQYDERQSVKGRLMSQRGYQLFVSTMLLVALLLALLSGTWQGWPSTLHAQSADSSDPVWAQVQASGTLRVGTAADYLPFGYHTETGELDGYDIAFSRALGDVLGVQVELRDMAFDGLLGALQLGEIDVAIAALSPTPERSALVDFTNVYYVGQDAVIAGKRSTIVINTVNDLVTYRVGVQRGSAYADWLRDTLVQPGLMPAENLLVYATIPAALRDMFQQRLDLLVMDAAPAETYVARGSVKLVAEGLNKQRFAIAVPKGADSLREQLNSAVAELQADGEMLALAQRYLPLAANQVQPIPTPEPQPTSAPAPPPTPTAQVSCIDGAMLVGHLTLDDRNMSTPALFALGQTFQKGWQLRNTGTCTWDSRYALIPTQDANGAIPIGGNAIPVAGTVAPGQEFAFYTNLTAPTLPGTYQSFWTMRNGEGITFGDRTWVGIATFDPAIPTPTPTSVSSISGEFYADRTTVRPGECATFVWRFDNISAIFFSEAGADWQQFGVGGQDQRSRCPVNTTTYELRVVDRNGTITMRQITIRVEGEAVPQIRRFDLNPAEQITRPQCVTLTWDVQGQVQQVSIRRDGNSLWSSAPLIGSMQDCPQESGTVTYTLEARGPSVGYAVQRILRVN